MVDSWVEFADVAEAVADAVAAVAEAHVAVAAVADVQLLLAVSLSLIHI